MTRLLSAVILAVSFSLGCSSAGSESTTSGGQTSGGTTTGGTSVTGGSTATSTGGTVGGTTGSSVVGACSASVKPLPRLPCLAPFPCGCPLECVFDPAFGGSVCEAPCNGSESCGDPTTSCVDGYCQLNACAATPIGIGAAGTLDAVCNAGGTADGTCLPMGLSTLPDGGLGSTWGVCIQGGTSDGGCQADAGRGVNEQLLCPAGEVCSSVGCQLACDPTQDGGCDGGSCTPMLGAGSAQAGYCGELRGQTSCGTYPYGPYGMRVGQTLPWTFQDLGYWDPMGAWLVDGGVPDPTTNALFDELYCSRVDGYRFALVQFVTEDGSYGQGQALDFSRHVNGPDGYWRASGGQVVQIMEIGHSGFPPSQTELTTWIQNDQVNFSMAIDTGQVLKPLIDATGGWPVTFIVDLGTMRILNARSYGADVGQIDLDFTTILASDGG